MEAEVFKLKKKNKALKEISNQAIKDRKDLHVENVKLLTKITNLVKKQETPKTKKKSVKSQYLFAQLVEKDHELDTMKD